MNTLAFLALGSWVHRWIPSLFPLLFFILKYKYQVLKNSAIILKRDGDENNVRKGWGNKEKANNLMKEGWRPWYMEEKQELILKEPAGDLHNQKHTHSWAYNCKKLFTYKPASDTGDGT